MYVLIIILTVGFVLLAGWIIFIRRELHMLQEILENAMSQIGVQLSFRWDTLAAMMNLADRYGACKNRAFADTMKARRLVEYTSTASEAAEQENLFQKGMRYIQATAWEYSEIQDDRVYRELMDSIRIYEGMSHQSRLIYNDGVTRLNRRIRRFPANLAAGVMGISEQDYLEMKEDMGGGEMDSIISEGLYDNVLEADITNNCLIGKNCAELLALLGISRDSSYSECIDTIIRKMVKPEYHVLYREKFGRERILQRFMNGERQFSLEFEERPDLIHYQRTTAAVCIYQDKRDPAVRIVSYVRHNNQDKKLAVLERKNLDSLTGLPDRGAAERDISAILRKSPSTFHALLLVEFVNLNEISRLLDSGESGRLIKKAGELLRIQFREHDIVGHLGEARFMIFMQNCGSEQTVQDKMKQIQDRLPELYVDGQENIHLTIQGGCTLYPRDGTEFTELFCAAENILGHLKESGQDCTVQFAHF